MSKKLQPAALTSTARPPAKSSGSAISVTRRSRGSISRSTTAARIGRGSAEVGVEAALHALGGEHGPAEGVADQRLLLVRLDEGSQRALGVVAVLLLGLHVDLVELECLLGDVVVAEG